MKYHENHIEYKYIDNLKQLQERLYFLYAEENAGNNNSHNEIIGVIKFTIEEFEEHVDSPKGKKYILKLINRLPKGPIESGSYTTNLYHYSNTYIFAQEMCGNNNFHNEK